MKSRCLRRSGQLSPSWVCRKNEVRVSSSSPAPPDNIPKPSRLLSSKMRALSSTVFRQLCHFRGSISPFNSSPEVKKPKRITSWSILMTTSFQLRTSFFLLSLEYVTKALSSVLLLPEISHNFTLASHCRFYLQILYERRPLSLVLN